MLSTVSTLRLVRLAARVRLADAARHIGMADTQLSRLERMEDPITTRQLERLAELYECDREQLHGRVPLSIAARPPSLRR